jgi:hypothetical protein
MRRIALLPLALALALAAMPAVAVAGVPQYPDLRTLPPRDLRFDRTDVSIAGTGDFRNVVRFSNTVTNQGEGKLLLRGTFGANTTSAPAVQHIYDSSGADVEQHTVGSYTWHAAHQHYHFTDWGRYELWTRSGYDAWLAAGRPTTMAPDVAGSKTTSCVMDEEFIRTLPGTPWPGVFPGSGCGLDSSNVMTQGLSVGWGDTYDYYRQEQWIDLGQGTLADGAYVLRSVTDPFDHIYESAGKADLTRESPVANEAVTNFTVAGGALVDGDRPTGTLSINGVDATTASSQVTVRVLGRDDVTGVKQVRISNDGLTWATHPYGGVDSTPMTIAWDLTDQRYGGSPAGGARTVYAQFQDGTGKWSASEIDTIDWTGGTDPAPVPAGSDYSAAIRNEAPVSWWRLGEASGTRAADQMGRNTGTYNGGPSLGAVGLLASDRDRAATFDGVNDHVATPGTGLAPGSGLSLEAWVRPTSLPAGGQFASIATRPDAYSLQLNGPLLEWTVIDGVGTRHRLQAPAGAIEPGRTAHVAGTYDGVTQRLYVDGVEVARTALTGAAGAGAGFYIGSWNGSQEFFSGTIDEVAVYDKVLTGLQVKKHHDLGIATTVGIPRPTRLTARPSGGAVDLSWNDNAGNETGYAVERASTASFADAARIELPADATSYTDTGLAAGRTYWYRVQATGPADSSAYSDAVSATLESASGDAGAGARATARYAAAVLRDSPLSYWRLDETSGVVARDERGVNPGIYRNGPTLGVTGLLGAGAGLALRLDGANDSVAVPNRAGLALGSAFALEAWIRPAFLPAKGYFASIVSKPESYALQLHGDRLELTVMQRGARRRAQAPAGALRPGGTYHVVGTYDGAHLRLYVNGRQVASRALKGRASDTAYAVNIGAWGGRGEEFGGVVDEVAVYHHALSAAHIREHDAAGGPAAGGALNGVRARRTRPAQAATRRAYLRRLHRRRR